MCYLYPVVQIVLKMKVYKNHYSVVKGYFRFEKLLGNRYFTRYRVLKLRCLLDYNIIFLRKYVNLASTFLIKMHKRKEPPSYRFTFTPLLEPLRFRAHFKHVNQEAIVHPVFMLVPPLAVLYPSRWSPFLFDVLIHGWKVYCYMRDNDFHLPFLKEIRPHLHLPHPPPSNGFFKRGHACS